MESSTPDPVTTDVMTEICCIVLHCDRNLSKTTINRRSAAVFGLKPKLIVLLWYNLGGLIPKIAKLHHLLWALLFLKLYEVEEARACRLQIDEETCRKWTKIFVKAIS